MCDSTGFLQNKCVALYAKTPDLKIVYVGSGFVLALDESVYLITAGHVLSTIRDSDSKMALRSDGDLPLVGFKKTIRTSEVSSETGDDIDLAVLEFEDAFKETDAFEKHSIKEHQLVDRSKNIEYDHAMVHGYPRSKNKKNSHDGTTSTFITTIDDEFDLSLLGNKSEDTHIALKWVELVDTGNPVKHQPTSPRGLSGSPVWIVSGEISEKNCQVVGVFIEYESKYNIGVSTNISSVLSIIDEYFRWQ